MILCFRVRYLQVTIYLSDVDIDTRNGEIVFKVWPLPGYLVTVHTGLPSTSVLSTSAVSLSPTHPTHRANGPIFLGGSRPLHPT